MTPDKQPPTTVDAPAVLGSAYSGTTMTFVSYGLRFAVCCDDEALLDLIGAWLPPGTKRVAQPFADRVFYMCRTPNNPTPFRLYGGRVLLAESCNETELLFQLEAAVGVFVAENALDHIFIHAGCVSWKDMAIIIPGRSYSGKTSLVSALLRAGATYYSDEYCVLDNAGLVRPYPRRLSLRSANGRIKVTAEELGSVSGSAGISAGRLIFTAFEANACWEPQRLTPGESVMKLLDNTVGARRSPDLALPALIRLAESADGFFSLRGDADECVADILRSF